MKIENLKSKTEKGFTLIELILVIGIVFSISFLAAPFLSRFFNQNAVANTVDQLTGELRKAQTYSMAGKQGGQWGVTYTNSKIILFQGSTYATRNSVFDESFSVASNVTITGLTELAFNRLTGTPSAMPIITVSGGGNTKTLAVNAQGILNNNVSTASASTWFDTSYLFKKKITIDHTKIAVNTIAPAVSFMESGTDATRGLSFWSSFDSQETSDCTTSVTGPCSIKFNSGAAGAIAVLHEANVASDSGTRISFYMKFDSFTNSGSQNIVELWNNTDSTYVWSPVSLAPDHKLTSDGSSEGTTVLQTGVWYRISLAYTLTSASVNQWRVYLNGNLEISESNNTTYSTGTNYIRIGLIANADGNNVVQHLDDIYADQGNDLSDPGDIHVTNKRPNANGTNSQFTTQIGSGGSGYGTGHSPQVNEQPLSLTNGWRISTANQLENYAIENAATGDVNIGSATLLADSAWVDATSASACAGTITNNGTTTTSIALTTTDQTFTKITSKTSYPSNSAGVGIKSCASATQVNLFEAGMLIAYTTNPTTMYANMPVLINLTTDANLAANAQSTGNDIFFTDAAEHTKLSHEIEKYTSASGALVAWVNVPTLSSTTDTVIYMYYGNAVASNQQNPTGVWDTNYLGVWHMNNDPSGTAPQIKDSTSAVNSGTQTGMVVGDQVTGQDDGGLNFNNTSKYVTTKNSNSIQGQTQVTISAWVKTTVLDGFNHTIYAEHINTNNDTARLNFLLEQTNAGAQHFLLEGRAPDGGTFTLYDRNPTTLAINTWYYVVAVFDSVSGVHHIMINGVDNAFTQATAAFSNTAPIDPPAIGRFSASSGEYWSGTMDEVRVSKIYRPPGWSTTEFNNQNSPSTFYTVGAAVAQ